MGAGHEHQAQGGEGTDNNVPLTDTQRTITIIVHYLAFVVGALVLWAFLKRIDTLRNRIWGPFILLLALVWMQVASALEIGNHYYEGNWELAGFPSDLVNGSFYFFNFGAQYMSALGLRRKDVPFFRRPKGSSNVKECILDLTAMVFDILMVVAIIITAPLYAVIGRDQAISVISAFGAIAGVGIVFRLWRNLGPNCWTLWGGILYLTCALIGVGMTGVYRNTGIEWLHIFIGGSFVTSLIPFTVAILHADEDPIQNQHNQEDGDDVEVTDSLLVEKKIDQEDKTHTLSSGENGIMNEEEVSTNKGSEEIA